MKSKKNKMKLSRKKKNNKGYNKIIMGGATNPKSVPKRAPRRFKTRIKELQKDYYNNNIQFIQEHMVEDARINEALKQEYMTKYTDLQQIQRLGHMQQDEKTQVSQQLGKELQYLRNFLEKRINMAKKMRNNANKEKSLSNWVNRTLPLLEKEN